MSITTQPSIKEILSKGVSLKVCGFTDKSELESAIEMGVLVIGVNFWSQSKRYVSAADAVSLLKPFSGKLIRVGVFVNAVTSEIIDLLANDIIDVAQLHGDESATDCEAIKSLGYSVIKAFGVDNTLTSEKIRDYDVDAILLDAHAPEEYGGTGKTFDWDVAKSLATENPNLPFILAGGITLENIDKAISESGARMIDVASGAEISPGKKDIEKVKKLLDITNKNNF